MASTLQVPDRLSRVTDVDELPAKSAIGVDVGGTNITAGIIDKKNKVVARNKIDTEADGGPKHVIQRICQCIDELIDKADVSRDDLCGIGLGIPGAVDVDKGTVLNAVNLCWRNLTLNDEVSKAIKLPVTLDNDVNVGTWGEYLLGAGKKHDSVLGVFVGTGIGGGLVLDGQLYHGTFGTAGEIGQTIINAHAAFGSRTLEEWASRTAIVNRLHRMIDANHQSEIRELAGKKWPRIRSKVLAKAFDANDPLTERIIVEAAGALGLAIASMVTMLSLECVVVGGGLTEALSDRWIDLIRKSFEDAVFPGELKDRVKVVASKLDDDAGLIGAALLARQRLVAE